MSSSMRFLQLLFVVAAAPALSQESPHPPVVEVLTLADAERIAPEQSPLLDQANARTRSAQARADAASSAWWPQVRLNAGYDRGTANQGSSARVPDPKAPSLDTFDQLTAGVSADHLVWDFGRTTGTVGAARSTAEARSFDEEQTRRQVLASVRQAYFEAVAARALRDIAQQNLDNQLRHEEQVNAFVDIGRRPEIDRAQIRSQVANARLDLVNAEADRSNARVTLARTAGLHSVPRDVEPTLAAVVEGEDGDAKALRDEALAARPDLRSLEAQIESARRTVAATRGDYWPSISVGVGADARGSAIDGLGPNASAGVSMAWPLFEGFRTNADVRGAEADVNVLEATRDNARLQIESDVESARVSVVAAREAVAAAQLAVDAARTQLDLAEARYENGAGNVIELADAQLALNQAAGKKAQAEARLSSARAALLLALGH